MKSASNLVRELLAASRRVGLVALASACAACTRERPESAIEAGGQALEVHVVTKEGAP